MEGSKNGGNEAADGVESYLRRRQLGASRGAAYNTGRVFVVMKRPPAMGGAAIGRGHRGR
jgi:hypothetical protein